MEKVETIRVSTQHPRNGPSVDWLQVPRIYSDKRHPTKEIKDGEHFTFRRNDNPHCTLTSLYFTVIKTERRFTSSDLHFTFYAITGEATPNQTEFTELANPTLKRRYVNQIAVIECTHGWIDNLDVFDRSLNPGGATESPKRCGIGTVLTELCLIDPDINSGKEGNLAREILSEFPEFADRVKRNCHFMVGLGMAAQPYEGANVYFNAAINMVYGLLLIETSTTENPIDYSDPNAIRIFPTQKAKDDYDPNTGHIVPCADCDGMCEAWGRRWFFCAGTDPRRILS